MLKKIFLSLLFVNNLFSWVSNYKIYKHFDLNLTRSFSEIDFSHQPKWDNNFDFDIIEKQIINNPIVKIVDIRKYLTKIRLLHPVFLAQLSNGLVGVFKPEKRLHFAIAETAAYQASKFLKLNLVPPTFLKEFNGMHGSFQFFLTDAKISKDHLSQISAKDISDMNLFFFIFSQTDNKSLNQIFQVNNGKAYLALIDNAHMYFIQNTKFGDKPYKCINGQKANAQCPFKKAITIKNISRKKFDSIFRKYLTKEDANKYFREAVKNKQITYILDKNILWIRKDIHRLNFTDKFYRSTINEFKRLNTESLNKIWHDGLLHDKNHVEFLIKLTVERKDQILKIAKSKTLN